MKNILHTVRAVLLALTVICAAGCIEDHTNHNLSTDNQDLVCGILSPAGTKYFDIGMPIELESVIILNDPTLQESDLEYEWYMAGELVSTDRHAKIPNTYAPGSYYAGLVVIDRRYGSRYRHLGSSELEDGRKIYGSVTVQVSSPYIDGFAVLTSDNGKSKLGHIRYTHADGWREFSPDIYPATNDGEDLGGEPVSLVYHYYFGSPYFAGLHVNQNGGVGAVDILVSSMQRIGRFDQQFIGGYPAGMKVRDVRYYKQNVILLTEDGDIYARPEKGNPAADVAPHIGRFPSSPVFIEDGARITKWVNKFEHSGSTGNKIIMFDDLNKRLLTIVSQTTQIVEMNQYKEGDKELIKEGDPGTDGTNTYPGLAFPLPEDLTGYDVSILGTYGAFFNNNSPNYGNTGNNFNVMAVLKRESDDKHFMYQFYWSDPTTGPDINLKKFYPFPVEIDDDVRWAIYPQGNPFMFFTAAGNTELYFMNLETNEYMLVYTADTPITAIQSGTISVAAYETGGNPAESSTGLYWQKLAIGTRGGKVTIFDAPPATLHEGGGLEELKTYDVSQWGPVVDLAFMCAQNGRMYSIGRR